VAETVAANRQEFYGDRPCTKDGEVSFLWRSGHAIHLAWPVLAFSRAIRHFHTSGNGRRPSRSKGKEMLRIWVIAGIAVAASTGPTLGQDAAAGEQVFRRLCSPCHEIGPDAKTKLGPPLNGIDGRKSGTFDGFNYSPANKSSGITWSGETFPKYIRAPMQDMPGTRMAFVGIKNDKDIADLWAYLKQFGADGAKK
jgi:cytochrome c